MKTFLLSILLLGFFYTGAQTVGPPKNVGREYGNPKMPWFVSHLAGANKERLKRANGNSHSIFGKIVCFRKLCRIQSGHSASLRAISFKKFQKKVARNAKKGAYKNIRINSPVVPNTIPVMTDTAHTQPAIPAPAVKADSLIVLGAELLFETDKSTLRREHFETLHSIVDYLLSHPERLVSISGHTDNTGREAHNLTLSKQRADVVAEYLVSNGIDINRIKTSGLGSSKPITANATEEGRKKNRRVELLIHSEQ